MSFFFSWKINLNFCQIKTRPYQNSVLYVSVPFTGDHMHVVLKGADNQVRALVQILYSELVYQFGWFIHITCQFCRTEGRVAYDQSVHLQGRVRLARNRPDFGRTFEDWQTLAEQFCLITSTLQFKPQQKQVARTM